jgi:hypothetical protein
MVLNRQMIYFISSLLDYPPAALLQLGIQLSIAGVIGYFAWKRVHNRRQPAAPSPKGPKSPADAIRLAEWHLRAHQPNGYRLEVDHCQAKRSKLDGWWYVVVRPTNPDVPKSQWIDMMIEAEMDIHEKGEGRVRLVSELPDHEMTVF